MGSWVVPHEAAQLLDITLGEIQNLSCCRNMFPQMSKGQELWFLHPAHSRIFVYYLRSAYPLATTRI